MKLLHLRNATALLTLGEHRFVIDPMLGAPGSTMAFKVFGKGRRRNPLVPLPGAATAALDHATAALVTHPHPDHLDRAGIALLRERALPVWTNAKAAAALSQKGLDARPLEDGAMGMRIETIASRHGRGLLGLALGHVTGFFLAHPGEPSVYLAGDTILTESVREAIARLRPDVLVLPAGAANMGLGGDILLSLDEVFELVRLGEGQVVLNHLEALDHCPTTRRDARERARREGVGERVHVPDDGVELTWRGDRLSA